MKRWTIGILIGAAIAILPTAGCRRLSLDASRFTVEVVDGVRHIHNLRPQLGSAPGAKLEILGKIGELETEDEKKILYDPVDAARLPNGDILVLEGKGRRVKRFNRDYELISSFGQKGQGPGDFNEPYLLRLNQERDRIYIADIKISKYFIDGRFEDGFKPERIRTGGSINSEYQTSGMAAFSGSRVVLPDDAWFAKNSDKQTLLSVYDRGGAILRSLGLAKKYEDPKLMLMANVAYFAAGQDDHLHVAFGFQNRIEEYEPEGRMISSSDWVLPFEVKNELKEELFTSGSMEMKIPWPSVTSVTKGIFLDAKKRIWVLTYLKQPDKFGHFNKKDKPSDCWEFNVFDSGGVQLFKVPVPDVGFDSFSLYDNRLYLIDTKNESCVYEYKIVDTR